MSGDRPTWGTHRWLQQTNGVIPLRERPAFVARAWWAAIPTLTSAAYTQLIWKFRPSQGNLGFDWRETPDSPFARAAADECADRFGAAAMVNHSYRSWVFGRAIAERQGQTVDSEALFVAAMLHDIGLAQPSAGHCFTRTGGDVAIELAERFGQPEATGLAIADAIGQHVNPGLRNTDHQRLGFYLQAGSVLDLGGRRMHQLPRDTVQEITCTTWRAEGIQRDVSDRWRAEAKAVPGGRAHLLHRWTGFGWAARLAPIPPRRCQHLAEDSTDR